MKELQANKLVNLLELLVGLWALAGPIWSGLYSSGSAQTNATVVGVVLIVVAIVQYFWNHQATAWVYGIVSAWLFLSIFVYDMSMSVVTSQVITAILGIVFAYCGGVLLKSTANNR